MSSRRENPETSLRAPENRVFPLRRTQARRHQRRSQAQLILYLSLPVIFLLLVLVRPPASFYTLPLISIALAAVLYEFVGGTIAALAAMVGVAAIIALDPLATRRAIILQEVWPILLMYLAVGPLVGWLATRERERERALLAAARRLHVVQEIAQAINSSLDREQTLTAIIAETRRFISFTTAAVILREGDRLWVAATNEEQEQLAMGQTFALSGTAVEQAIQSGQIWVGRSGDAARYPDARLICATAPSCLITPLKVQETVIGAFALAGKGLDELPLADRSNLGQIADQIAIAMEHARLYELERARARALAAISDAGREIAASLDVERTLRLVMQKASETLPMDAGALFLFDDEAQMYRVAVSHNLSPERVEKIAFAFDEGVPGWVVQNRLPLIIDDATRDERVHPAVLAEGVRSVLAIPLAARERLVGVLNLFCLTGTGAFDAAALRLAQVYADQAAVFIENARLVEQLRRAAAELEARVERRTEQLRRTQAQVIRAEKMAAVGRLAASVAHEVNNPLQAIALHLQLVGEEGLTETAVSQLIVVRQELDRIAGIVQRLLEFQRPKSGERARQDVAALVDNVLALAGKQLQQANVAVTWEKPDDLPPVTAVGDQLKQVFLNLVLNGIEAMPDGGQLWINVCQSDDAITIAFSDTGVGMSEAVMAQLFEPFFSTKPGGSGLGLAVSHEIVANHGGTLTAGSEPGHGATFTVRLPV